MHPTDHETQLYTPRHLSFKSVNQLHKVQRERIGKFMVSPSPRPKYAQQPLRETEKQNIPTSFEKVALFPNSSRYRTEQSNVVEGFKLERESLKSALSIYKDQLTCLEKQNNKLKQNLQQIRDTHYDHGQIQAIKEKAQEYENLLPKLIELEDMQQALIEDNGLLKEKNKVNEALLMNLANISRLGHHPDSVISMVRSLTEAFLHCNHR